MKIQFVGTGGMFDFGKGNAAALIEINNTTFLLDCGYETLTTLVEKNAVANIDYILLTHTHCDHVGSLPALLAYYTYKLERVVPSIITPTELFQTETNQYLSSTYAIQHAVYRSISDFPYVGYIETTNQHVEGMTSFAYYFSDGEQLIYYSGDIGNAQTAKAFLDGRSETNITVFHETTPQLDLAVHVSYREVQDTLKNYDVYVYHIAKENMPEDCTLKYVEDYPEFLL